MRKIIFILIVLIAISALTAQDRFTTTISYFNNTVTHYTTCPGDLGTTGIFTKVSTVFTPLAPVSLLYGFQGIFYQAGQVGNQNIIAEVWAVDQVTGLPTGAAPLASVTKLFADIVWWTGDTAITTFFDFASFALSFAEGQKFALVVYAQAGVPTTAVITPMINLGLSGHSYRYFTSGTPLGWRLAVREFTFTANVEYDVPLQDVKAKSLWFTGDFFLQPGDIIAYEADVQNMGIPQTNVPIYLEVYDLATPATPIWSDVVYLDMPDTNVVHIDTFDPYTFPAVRGEYSVVLRTALSTDMVPANNQILLEQQTVIVPDLLDYDDGVGETAHAWYNAGDAWANAFQFYAEEVKLKEISFNIRDNTWPSGAAANPFLQYAIYADDPVTPGVPGAILYTSPVVGCTLGAWNTYDVSAQNLIFAPGVPFYVAYIQVGNYPNCPGLVGDMTPPFACWSMSYDLVAGVWYWPDAYDEDMMIRAYVEAAAPPPPVITVSIVAGDTVVEWERVIGANSYNVYSSDDPYNNWYFVETTTDLSVTYAGTDPKLFFKVTACTNYDGTKAIAKKTTAMNETPTSRSSSNSISQKATRPSLD